MRIGFRAHTDSETAIPVALSGGGVVAMASGIGRQRPCYSDAERLKVIQYYGCEECSTRRLALQSQVYDEACKVTDLHPRSSWVESP